MTKRRKLKRIGYALHISPIAPNILIIKTREYLKPGTVIYNSELNEVGTVIETFGPVTSPYARVKISSNISQTIINSLNNLYVITGERKKVIWRKMPGLKRRRR